MIRLFLTSQLWNQPQDVASEGCSFQTVTIKTRGLGQLLL